MGEEAEAEAEALAPDLVSISDLFADVKADLLADADAEEEADLLADADAEEEADLGSGFMTGLISVNSSTRVFVTAISGVGISKSNLVVDDGGGKTVIGLFNIIVVIVI